MHFHILLLLLLYKTKSTNCHLLFYELSHVLSCFSYQTNNQKLRYILSSSPTFEITQMFYWISEIE
jgi:hypothetical protein